MDLSLLTDEILDNFPLRQDICLDKLQIVKGNRHYKSNDSIQIILDRYTQIDEVCFDFGEDCVSCVDK
jgi:F0F1-type ATP synthase beta subunit